MIVNKNPCFVDIRRKPGYCGWEIFFGMQTGQSTYAIAQPTEIIFKEQKEADELKPAFTIYHSPDTENWLEVTAEAIFRILPNLREKFVTKRNEEEIAALKEHIKNLNEIIKSLNPNVDIRDKISDRPECLTMKR